MQTLLRTLAASVAASFGVSPEAGRALATIMADKGLPAARREAGRILSASPSTAERRWRDFIGLAKRSRSIIGTARHLRKVRRANSYDVMADPGRRLVRYREGRDGTLGSLDSMLERLCAAVWACRDNLLALDYRQAGAWQHYAELAYAQARRIVRYVNDRPASEAARRIESATKASRFERIAGTQGTLRETVTSQDVIDATRAGRLTTQTHRAAFFADRQAARRERAAWAGRKPLDLSARRPARAKDVRLTVSREGVKREANLGPASEAAEHRIYVADAGTYRRLDADVITRNLRSRDLATREAAESDYDRLIGLLGGLTEGEAPDLPGCATKPDVQVGPMGKLQPAVRQARDWWCIGFETATGVRRLAPPILALTSKGPRGSSGAYAHLPAERWYRGTDGSE